MAQYKCLTVGLGHTLDLVLLLDGVGVGGTLGSVLELLSEALGDGLDVAEGRITGTSGEQVNGRVHTTQGGDINGLTTHNTSRADAARVLTGTRVDDSVDNHLDGVLASGEVDDVAAVLHDAHSKDLLAVVTS